MDPLAFRTLQNKFLRSLGGHMGSIALVLHQDISRGATSIKLMSLHLGSDKHNLRYNAERDVISSKYLW